MQEAPTYTLSQIINYFFRLGYSGFGGPVALVNYMHRDLVEKNKWISEEDYRDGLALAQLAPGPLAAQLSIYIGFIHYRILGATLCGLAFVLPSFVMVVIIGIAYKMYGGLSWMQAIFYGVGSAVVGIIIMSCYRLIEKSIGKINPAAIQKSWMLWIFFILSATITVYTQKENILICVVCGIAYALYKSSKEKVGVVRNGLFILNTGFWQFDPKDLEKIALFFGKAGAFVFGSGLAIIPFLHSEVVNEMHWLSEAEFLDAVAVAMITPGPVVITVSFIGYLVAGFPGATVAALATFLPCYLFTVIPAPYFKKYGRRPVIKNFVDGITASVIGMLAGAVAVISLRAITDIPALIIAVITILLLIRYKKLKEPVIILLAAIVGLILKSI
ncbi:chromate transporter [Pollutibacter soli]|uniref:chromate transporter n=1 Tax=Pollutibacter soli TaxID=3034157 RepID=UPI003013F1B0